MKLIDLLVQELPERGGWPDGAVDAGFLCGSDTLYFSNENGDCPGEWRINMSLKPDYLAEEVTREQYQAALAAAQPQWDGQGLPPVGCVCEYAKKSIPCNEWTECTVDYVGSAFIVYRDCYGVELTGIKGDIIFRPIRSEADKKREKGVIALSRVDPRVAPFEYGDKFPDGSLVGAPWYELYDAIAAGKIPGLRIE